jgi:hypothetical protein
LLLQISYILLNNKQHIHFSVFTKVFPTFAMITNKYTAPYTTQNAKYYRGEYRQASRKEATAQFLQPMNTAKQQGRQQV